MSLLSWDGLLGALHELVDPVVAVVLHKPGLIGLLVLHGDDGILLCSRLEFVLLVGRPPPAGVGTARNANADGGLRSPLDQLGVVGDGTDQAAVVFVITVKVQQVLGLRLLPHLDSSGQEDIHTVAGVALLDDGGTCRCPDVDHALCKMEAQVLGQGPEGVDLSQKHSQQLDVVLGPVLRAAFERPEAQRGEQAVDGRCGPGDQAHLAQEVAVG
mmetsp:Transcript_28302/g.79882  ORF Transcript_28302/g.79882 Transcript_28302/m.79882 type:complete len:214 (-) Transcript_28302:729-1370(-)